MLLALAFICATCFFPPHLSKLICHWSVLLVLICAALALDGVMAVVSLNLNFSGQAGMPKISPILHYGQNALFPNNQCLLVWHVSGPKNVYKYLIC
uniref:Uncharacterized protein n=1 Tax=Anguilla anguilla TaxID=7936 RepID=A0A0E9WU94_ANGAN